MSSSSHCISMHTTGKLLFFLLSLIGTCHFALPAFSLSRSILPQPEEQAIDTDATPLEVIKTDKSHDAIERQSEQSSAQTDAGSDLWSLIRDKLQFHGHLGQASVAERVAWLADNQDYVDRFIERARPYLFHIVSRLEARGMPLDLALLPVVESAYQPFAHSPRHASGIWQFMPATGKRYGLKQDWWYDGRRDITASTEAALDYLEALHKRFNGDWLHALAAYNLGEGKVGRAIRKNRKAQKKTDFWSLRLPRETRNYVPSLLALVEVLKNSQKYNIHFNPVLRHAYFEAVDTGSQIDLATVAKLSGLNINEIYRLNPGFNRWATGPDGPHRLLIPIDIAEDFKQKLASLPESGRIGWTQYRVREGDSLSRIAARHRISVSALKKANRLKGNLIRTGHSLLLPIAKQPGKYYALSEETRKFKALEEVEEGRRYIYNVKSGDNLWEIARRYDVGIRQLRRWNGLNGTLLRPGQKLIIQIADAYDVSPGKAKKPTTLVKTATEKDGAYSYTVQRGDSLWLIARKFNIHVSSLLKWNDLKKDKFLQPGQSLIVKRAPAGA